MVFLVEFSRGWVGGGFESPPLRQLSEIALSLDNALSFVEVAEFDSCNFSNGSRKHVRNSPSCQIALLRWQKEPEFQKAYRAARRHAYGQSVASLQQATSAAVSMLLKVMVDASTPASTKVRAADSVLNRSAKAIEIEDIEARVAELERTTDDAKKAR